MENGLESTPSQFLQANFVDFRYGTVPTPRRLRVTSSYVFYRAKANISENSIAVDENNEIIYGVEERGETQIAKVMRETRDSERRDGYKSREYYWVMDAGDNSLHYIHQETERAARDIITHHLTVGYMDRRSGAFLALPARYIQRGHELELDIPRMSKAMTYADSVVGFPELPRLQRVERQPKGMMEFEHSNGNIVCYPTRLPGRFLPMIRNRSSLFDPEQPWRVWLSSRMFSYR